MLTTQSQKVDAVEEKVSILAGVDLLNHLGIEIIESDEQIGVGRATVSKSQTEKIAVHAHHFGRCGGFEIIDSVTARNALLDLKNIVLKDSQRSSKKISVPFNQDIADTLKKVNAANLESNVQWFSNFHTRYHNGSTANDHVYQLKRKIEDLIQSSSNPYASVDLISHQNTRQNSLRVRLAGKTRPSEIIVLGAHYDSINSNGFFPSPSARAPGADDNASGSSNLIEALRILLGKPQTERTIEIFFYAAEEGGLIGSSQIASQYKNAGVDVIGVLQLDMTLFPGSGVFTIGSMTDFTSQWMRDYMAEINKHYLHAKIVEDKCGYGCSDHASWYRQGYSTIMPFEATFNDMNSDLHTTRDVISEKLNFEHSAMFTKLALAIALDLGNSTLRAP